MNTYINKNNIYSFNEKYFQIEPEWRINRYQFFVRYFIPMNVLILLIILIPQITIITWLKIFQIDWLLTLLYIGFILNITLQIIFIVILYKIGIPVSIKRIRDFGFEWKKMILIIKTQIIANIFIIIMLISTISQINIPLMEYTWKICQTISLFSYIATLILLFRPGNKWDNQYGKDPINTKVWFLG